MIKYTNDIKITYKDKICPPVIDPDLNLFTGDFGSCPDVNNFYLKKVICVAPHLNFSKFKNEIKCSACSSVLHTKGWSKNIRNVHDLNGVCYAMIYNYTCNTGNCKEFNKEIHAYSKDDNDNTLRFTTDKVKARHQAAVKRLFSNSPTTVLDSNNDNSNDNNDNNNDNSNDYSYH